jgi:hypothetical protein
MIAGNICRSGNPYGAAAARTGKGPAQDGTILFRGCTPAYKTPEILASVEKLLARQGIAYGFLDDEPCCGNILFNLGDRATGSEIVDENIVRFKAAGVKRIITVCPGCYSAFNKYYKGRYGFDPEVVLEEGRGDGEDDREAREVEEEGQEDHPHGRRPRGGRAGPQEDRIVGFHGRSQRLVRSILPAHRNRAHIYLLDSGCSMLAPRKPDPGARNP